MAGKLDSKLYRIRIGYLTVASGGGARGPVDSWVRGLCGGGINIHPAPLAGGGELGSGVVGAFL